MRFEKEGGACGRGRCTARAWRGSGNLGFRRSGPYLLRAPRRPIRGSEGHEGENLRLARSFFIEDHESDECCMNVVERTWSVWSGRVGVALLSDI